MCRQPHKHRFVELFGDIISNDRHWNVLKFSEITESRLGKMLDSKKNTGKNTFPYLANTNVQWFKFVLDDLKMMDFDENDQIEFKLEYGDLLVCEGGEIGRCAIWKNNVKNCFFQKALHRVRCKNQIIIPEYLSWWFKFNCEYQTFLDVEGSKSTIAHLTGAKLKALNVVVPELDVQIKFSEFLSLIDKSKVREITNFHNLSCHNMALVA